MSPELIAPQRFGLESNRPTESSDCYALGMVIYETISGNLPFHKDADLTVFLKVVEGKHPPRGAKFRNSLWTLLEKCWRPQPNDRPDIGYVLRYLGIFSHSPEPPSLEVGEGMETDGDHGDSANSFSGGTSSAIIDTSFDSSHVISRLVCPVLGCGSIFARRFDLKGTLLHPLCETVPTCRFSPHAFTSQRNVIPVQAVWVWERVYQYL